MKADDRTRDAAYFTDLIRPFLVVKLDPAYRSGSLTGTITDPGLDLSATIVAFATFRYAVNVTIHHHLRAGRELPGHSIATHLNVMSGAAYYPERVRGSRLNHFGY